MDEYAGRWVDRQMDGWMDDRIFSRLQPSAEAQFCDLRGFRLRVVPWERDSQSTGRAGPQ